MSNSTIKKIAGFILLLILAVPYQTEYVPEWKVQVVNTKGIAMENIAVEQKYYYINISQKTETKTTDEDGYVTFPARTFTCPLICRIPVSISNIIFSLGPGGNTWGGATVVEKDSFDFSHYVNGKTRKSDMKHKFTLKKIVY